MKPLLLVLTVIRNAETRSLARIVLEGAGHRVIESGGCAQAQALLENGLRPDLLVLECSSAELSLTVRDYKLIALASSGSLCIITGLGDQEVRERVAELRGAQFLTRPVTREDIESIIDRMGSTSAERGVCKGGAQLRTEPIASDETDTTSIEASAAPYIEELGSGRYFLAASPQMLEIHRKVKLLADVDVNVLILGESGTGKEVVAHLIHKNSQRASERFLNVNCAALPADLLESELFGHRQGAFTGAIKDRAGKFEQAHRGTLLLDEIGEIPFQMQAKLLHVLQDGQFTRLGGQESTKVDVRILAATNVELENALIEKTFREDLYYRLNAITIHVPPLRERREEIPYLIEETIRRTPAELKSGIESGFPARLFDVALLYDWRGNLRELRNFVTRTIIMRDADAAVRELETKIAAAGSSARQEESIPETVHRSGMRSIVRDVKERTEVQMMQDALELHGWNRRRAAEHLKISYRALLYKIQQHGLSPRAHIDVNEAFSARYSAQRNAN